jgi:hypothetical protein
MIRENFTEAQIFEIYLAYSALIGLFNENLQKQLPPSPNNKISKNAVLFHSFQRETRFPSPHFPIGHALMHNPQLGACIIFSPRLVSLRIL